MALTLLNEYRGTANSRFRPNGRNLEFAFREKDWRSFWRQKIGGVFGAKKRIGGVFGAKKLAEFFWRQLLAPNQKFQNSFGDLKK